MNLLVVGLLEAPQLKMVPLIDSLMNELGLQGGDINGLTQGLKPKAE